MERLEIQISDNADVAVGGIDRLAAALGRLRSATANSAGLNKVATALGKVATAATGTAFAQLDKAMAPIAASSEKISGINRNCRV
jgi:hypothetical protein